MNRINKKRFHRGFTIVLSLLTIVYAAGMFYLLLSWLGVLSYDPLTWQHDSLPFYTVVFMFGTVSSFRVWKLKKWGVYGLVGTWVLTAILNLVFIPAKPMPYPNIFFATLLVIAFILFLLPEWKRLE